MGQGTTRTQTDPRQVRGFDVHRADAPVNEQAFQAWYAAQVERVKHTTGFALDPNPDAPEHAYDYRAAFKAGKGPDAKGHWPSEFKRVGHDRLIVDGRDTRTGELAAAVSHEPARPGSSLRPDDPRLSDPTAGDPVPTGAGDLSDPTAGDPVAPPPDAPWNPISSQISGTLGAAKRVADYALSAGKIITASGSQNPVATFQALGPTPKALEPTTPEGRVGALGVDVAAAAIPQARGSALIERGATMLPRALQLPTRVAGEAALNAGIAGAQGGDPTTAAVIGGAIPLVGGVLRSLPTALRESAEKKVAQALAVQKEKWKAIAERRAGEILDRGLSGSRRSLLNQAAENSRESGRAIDDMLKTHGAQVVPLKPIDDALEQAKQGYTITRTMSLQDAVQQGVNLNAPGVTVTGNTVTRNVVLEAAPLQQLSQLQATLRELGDTATIDEIVGIRRVWDEVVDRAGGFAHKRAGSSFGVSLAEGTEAWAKKKATDAMRRLFAEEVPDFAAVNKEASFWIDLRKILRASNARQQAQGSGLSRVIGGIAGMSTGLATGGLTSALVYGYAVPKVMKMMTSTQWRLIDANLRNYLAEAIASGSKQRVAGAMARIGAVLASQATRSESGGRQP